MGTIKTRIKTKVKYLIERYPPIGRLLSSAMGLVEIPMLQVLNYINAHISPNFMIKFIKTFFEGKWGGRVVPLNINIPAETQYLPRQEILEIISRSRVFSIGICYCRTKHKNCDHPTHTCIGLTPLPGKSLHDIHYRDAKFKRVSKEKIVDILNDCDDRGLVHQLIYFPSPNYFYVICNCCTCCCEALHNYKKFLSPQIVKSDFVEQTALNKCVNCGTCVEFCPFDARVVINERLVVNQSKCFGCGLCINKCPEKAIKLLKKTQKEKS